MTHPLQHIREQIVREFEEKFVNTLSTVNVSVRVWRLKSGVIGDYFGPDEVEQFILSALTRYEEALVGEMIAEIEKLKLVVPDPKTVSWSHDFNSAIYKITDTLKEKLTSKGCCEKCSGFISTQIKGGKIESSLYCRDANCRCHTTNK